MCSLLLKWSVNFCWNWGSPQSSSSETGNRKSTKYRTKTDRAYSGRCHLLMAIRKDCA